MKHLSLPLALAMLTSPIAAPPAAAAQPPAPAPVQPRASPVSPAWAVDWGQYYCSMIRKPGPGRPFATAFVMTPGGSSTGVTLVPEPGQRAPGDVDTLVLLPGGAP